uniref:Uncharacterized protein n=1 Tax=Anguilla anguilla TaxID=7936 RepID=A0A0E9T2R6_ANGAN
MIMLIIANKHMFYFMSQLMQQVTYFVTCLIPVCRCPDRL